MPEVLEKHALHYKTGEPTPKTLLDKMLAGENVRRRASRQWSSPPSALVDMAYHARPDRAGRPLAFEAETLERLEMPDAIAMRHRTPHFQHVFAGRRIFSRLLFLHVV